MRTLPGATSTVYSPFESVTPLSGFSPSLAIVILAPWTGDRVTESVTIPETVAVPCACAPEIPQRETLHNAAVIRRITIILSMGFAGYPVLD